MLHEKKEFLYPTESNPIGPSPLREQASGYRVGHARWKRSPIGEVARRIAFPAFGIGKSMLDGRTSRATSAARG
jgi:hypothetical protein